MKKTKRILSLLTALTITASAFASMVIPASAETAVYVDENFDAYTAEQIQASNYYNKNAGEAAIDPPADVVKGSITYKAGQRNNGATTNTATVAAADAGKELVISADGTSTRSRGIGMVFNGVPTTLDAGEILELSMKVKATQKITVTGFGDVTTDNLTKTDDYVKLRAVQDKDAGKQYLIISDTSDTILNLVMSDLAATTISGMTFYNGAGKYNIDDIKVEKKARDTGLLTVAVKTSAGTAVSGASVKVGDKVLAATDDNGNAVLPLPYGEQSITVSKDGYEHTAEVGDDHTQTVTMNAAAVSSDFVLSAKSYTKEPKTVAIKDGQAYIAASKNDTPATTAAFTLEVADQFNVPMTSSEYTVAWAVYPTGTETADPAVTINNGIVSVTEAFAAEHDTAKYDIVASVTANNVTQKATKIITVGNSDIVYYEDVNFAELWRNGEIPLSGTVDLPDMVEIKLNLALYVDGQTTLALPAGTDKLVGLQLAGTTITAWTGWTGNKDMNQGDDTGKYTNSAELVTGYTPGTAIDVSFVLDTTNKNITVTSGNKSVPLPYTVETPTTLSKLLFGNYRLNGNGGGSGKVVELNSIAIQVPDENFVAVSGDDVFGKITGKTVKREYKYAPVVVVEGEKFNWSVTDASGAALQGASITDGVLSVTDAAPTGKAIVKVVSASNPDKKGEFEIEIKDVSSTYTPTIEGAKAVEKNSSSQYKVTKIVDEYGDDVTEYFTPVWSITGAPNTDSDVNFNVTQTGAAVAVSAVYDADGVLKSATAEEVTIPAEATSFTYSAPSGAKVMLWNSLEGMKPVSADTPTAPAVTIPDGTVAAVSAKTGTLTTYGNAGDVNLDVTIGGVKTTYPVKVGAFSLVEDYDAQKTAIDVSSIVENDAITAYKVTLADADGNVVAAQTVDAADVADGVALPPVEPGSAAPAKVEVDPVYTGVMNTEYLVPAGSYDVTVTANDGQRTDVYVNNQMIFNNINQGGDNWKLYNRTIKASEDYTSNGVVISKGSATFNYMDDKSGGTTIKAVKFVKTPSIVKRTQQVFVIGDSLVANYHGDRPDGAEGGYVRTGWGQVLQSYIKNAEVINLGNSGAWAAGMYNDAFTRVQQSAQPGDIVIWESGYNDDSHGKRPPMEEAMTKAANECKAMGVDLFFVTPNASGHDYKESVKMSGDIRDIATKTNTKLIDLSKDSYKFLSDRYGTTLDLTKLVPYYNNAYTDAGVLDGSQGDKALHSSYNAANCWAMVVAQGLYDQGYEDIVNTVFSYTFNDGTNDVVVQVTPKAE